VQALPGAELVACASLAQPPGRRRAGPSAPEGPHRARRELARVDAARKLESRRMHFDPTRRILEWRTSSKADSSGVDACAALGDLADARGVKLGVRTQLPVLPPTAAARAARRHDGG
jgi:hypothetical protein